MPFTKTYFLCPTSDFIHPPSAGPLCLGSIIRSTSTPQFPLNRSNIVPVVNENPPVVETDWKKTISAETGIGCGVYAQFLQLATGGLGLRPEVQFEKSSQTADTFAFDTVTTLSFEPTPQFIDDAVKAPAVQAYLQEPKQRFSPVVSLYLVTGMKLVKGAKIKYSVSGTKGVTGNIGIDVAPLAITAGPKAHWTKTNGDETEFSRNSEFVFAFRVKRLRFGRKVEAKEYNKGALLAIGENRTRGIECVLVDDLDGSDIPNATLVPDISECDNIYCIPS
ncbi:hypothetical protein N7462_002249 [Penicillium macrosclerotiorum]|uniref:uncharacterized protein n=1 Tax=Penicillium macrosclerotiorum TaxID=303699 RepID=UPI002547D7C5|nr:uncharacterized protein N7462_002249 [Penicillium macrosclerotiorum]KAJ5692826.1 hypothetical protein N7462_002249 [Penicillium macrosclerotiorum]